MIEDITKTVRKEFIYEIYYRTVEIPKEYEKITRKKMIKEIFDYYREDNHLELCLSYQDMIELNEIIKNGNILTLEKSHLYQLLLLNFIDYKTFCIHEDILPFIKEKIKTFDLEAAKQRDEMNHLVIGMIKGYGIIKEQNLNQMINIFNEINGTHLDLERDVLQNRIAREYYEIIDSEYGYYIVYKIFDEYIDEHMEIQNEGPLYVKIFEYNSLMNIAQYDFDISNSKIKKLYDQINQIKSQYARDNIKENLMIMLNLGHNYQDIEDFFLRFPYLKDKLSPLLLKCIKNAMNDIPIAIFNGMTINEMLEKEEQKENNSKYLKSVQQIRACLGEKEAKYFYKMYMNLLDYVNKKYHIIQENHLATARHVEPLDQVKVRNKMFEDMSIIDEYIQRNPNHLNSTILKQIEEVKNAIMVNCIIVKYEKNYTLIMDDQDILYAIIGGVSNLDEVIPSQELPYMCKLVLVPYKGKILYDGVIEGTNIQMGSGIQSRIIESIKNTEIHKTLPIIVN
ncbi:hypothetical protein [Candidatus Stoquefichus massiliensis]|uniref:hypothetical protein n=1 Tax=Candidatus Stoquefichus massiliensis TaxID=1470350 RepID=UPI0004865DCA|nr:hypothetical protein [Candidatus Stoquefichus massiliensis]